MLQAQEQSGEHPLCAASPGRAAPAGDALPAALAYRRGEAVGLPNPKSAHAAGSPQRCARVPVAQVCTGGTGAEAGGAADRKGGVCIDSAVQHDRRDGGGALTALMLGARMLQGPLRHLSMSQSKLSARCRMTHACTAVSMKGMVCNAVGALRLRAMKQA